VYNFAMKRCLALFYLSLTGCSSFSGLYQEQKLNRALFPSVCGHSYALSKEAMLAAVMEQVREDGVWHRRHDPLTYLASPVSDLRPPIEYLEEGIQVTGWREHYLIVADAERPGHTYLRVREKTEHGDRIPYKEWLVMKRIDPVLAEAVKSRALAEEPGLNFSPYPEG